MRRWIWIVIGLAVVLAVAFFAVWRQGASSTAAPEEADTVRVERKPLVASISASGSVSPKAQVALNFGAPGTVSQVPVVEGQAVRGGDVLARLDATELDLAVRQAEQALVMQQIARCLAPGRAEYRRAGRS